jgi:pyruvate/2-oxoglutarate dehydrogenase complex dihydrolipoamide dehydrogenase (E3) component
VQFTHDLIVLGGGSAGLSLASVAARLGVKVALVDKENLGGDCLHYGCVPSKTFIHSAKVAHLIRRSADYGISTGNVETDFPAVMKRVQQVIATIQEHTDNPDRFRAMGCDVWTETKAMFVDPHTVDAGGEKITAKKIAICVGSQPSSLPLSGLKEAGYLTNETVFSLTKQPKSLLIIGSGPIGCELAQAFERLGTQVILCNRSDQMLGKEDTDVQKVLRDIFEQEGIDLRLGIAMREVKRENGMKVLVYEKDGKRMTIEAEEILVAVGRKSNADALKVENAGVELDERGYVKTDAKLRTSQKHIYAAGDVTGHLQFTHSATYEAGIIVSNALLHLPARIHLNAIPWTTFTDPEVASIGLNETRAKENDIAYRASIFPFTHQDRALAEGENHGFIKILIDPKDRVLGCQIVGPHAGELIHEWIVAYNARVPLKKLSRMVHVYPTLAMGHQQAAGEYLGGKFLTPRTRFWMRKVFGYRNTAIDGLKAE